MAPSNRNHTPFRTNRLIFRAPRIPEDLDILTAIADDHIGHMNSSITNVKLPGKADAERYLKIIPDFLLSAVICLAREEGSDEPGTPIGEIHLSNSRPGTDHHRNTEIGISVLPAYQGQGCGSEAIRWALEYAFKRVGLHKVRIRAFEYNEGAWKLYERLGFKHEGREREAIWHEGRFWDGIEMGMIDREWWAIQEGSTKVVQG